MNTLDFDHEFGSALFRGNETDIQAIFKACGKGNCKSPICIEGNIWEVEVQNGNFLQLIETYPLLKATGYVLN